MMFRSATAAFWLALALSLAPGRALAENEGQADLDKATQLKLSATKLDDLNQVVQLCESALKKGLDQANTSFAKELLSSTLVQRGSEYASKAVRAGARNQKWQEDRKAALADLEKGIQLNPKQPQALLLIARLNLLPEGDAKRAADALDETIKSGTDEPLVRAEALLLRAALQSDVNKKLADLDEAVTAVPASGAVLRARGAARADLGKLEAALDDFNKAIELDPKQPASYLMKAMVLSKQKKYDEAISVLDMAEKLAPKTVELPVQKARIYSIRGNFKAALEELNRALAVDPDNLGVLILRAGVRQEMGDKQEALADVDRILASRRESKDAIPDPAVLALMRDRALLLSDLNRHEEAVAELEKLRKMNPKDELTLIQLGMLQSVQKKYPQAIEIFSAVLADHPESWLALRSRADCLLNTGRRADAIADYDKAMGFQPKNATILNNLAWILATAPEENLRDGKRALVLATEACRLTEYKADFILSTLAAAYAETGDFPSAIKWSTKAVEMGGKEHAEALKKEMESYKASKPWRENLPEDKPEAPPKPEAKPAAK